MSLWTVAVIVLLLNIPFGYWRANTTKMSLQWFLSVHIPVPMAIALRLYSGLGWQLITVPVLVGVFFSGQLLGATIHSLLQRHARRPITSCLVVDVVRHLQAL